MSLLTQLLTDAAQESDRSPRCCLSSHKHPCLPLPPDALRLLLTQLLTDAAQGVAGAAAAAVLLPLMLLPTNPLLMPCGCHPHSC